MSFLQARPLIVKAYYNDLVEQQPEIRRFAIDITPNNDAYQALESTIAQLNGNYQQGQFTLQYVDEDNDRITFSSDTEFRSALQMVPSDAVMKIYVKPKGQKTESKCNADSNVHPGISCDGCQGPVVGNRYKCMVCPDFDLCQGCSDKKLHPEHGMIKIARPMPHPFGGFRRCGGFGGFRGRGPFGMGRCGGGPRFWRHFMQQQQQGGQGDAFQFPADMAHFLGQFNGKELAELIEAHLPEYLRTEKINEMLNQFKTGEQAEKPVDHDVLLEHVGKFLREILSPFGIDCDYFVDHPTTANNGQNTTETTANKEKPEESANASASASTEPKPSAPSSNESSASATPPSFGNLLEQLQTMFVPMFQQGGAAAAANGTTTTAAASQVDQQAQEQKKIDECIERMTAMGFVDSNGILTELIKAKKGDLNQVLDALNPRNYTK